ncbi:hypothetical protein ACQ4PT_033512 [Festuca glaucescens]
MQGLVLLALSAGISPLRPASCEGISCPQATGKQFSVFFAALYLISIGTGGRQVGAAPVRGGAVHRGRRPGAGAEEAVLLHLVLRRHQPRHLRRRDARVLAAAERVMGARLRGLRPLPAPGGDWLPGRHALVQDAAARRP